MYQRSIPIEIIVARLKQILTDYRQGKGLVDFIKLIQQKDPIHRTNFINTYLWDQVYFNEERKDYREIFTDFFINQINNKLRYDPTLRFLFPDDEGNFADDSYRNLMTLALQLEFAFQNYELNKHLDNNGYNQEEKNTILEKANHGEILLGIDPKTNEEKIITKEKNKTKKNQTEETKKSSLHTSGIGMSYSFEPYYSFPEQSGNLASYGKKSQPAPLTPPQTAPQAQVSAENLDTAFAGAKQIAALNNLEANGNLIIGDFNIADDGRVSGSAYLPVKNQETPSTRGYDLYSFDFTGNEDENGEMVYEFTPNEDPQGNPFYLPEEILPKQILEQNLPYILPEIARKLATTSNMTPNINPEVADVNAPQTSLRQEMPRPEINPETDNEETLTADDSGNQSVKSPRRESVSPRPEKSAFPKQAPGGQQQPEAPESTPSYQPQRSSFFPSFSNKLSRGKVRPAKGSSSQGKQAMPTRSPIGPMPKAPSPMEGKKKINEQKANSQSLQPKKGEAGARRRLAPASESSGVMKAIKYATIGTAAAGVLGTASVGFLIGMS